LPSTKEVEPVPPRRRRPAPPCADLAACLQHLMQLHQPQWASEQSDKIMKAAKQMRKNTTQQRVTTGMFCEVWIRSHATPPLSHQWLAK